MGVANRDANLPDPAQTFLNEVLMSAVERLVTPDEQGGRFLRVERRAQQCQRALSPKVWRALRRDAHVKATRRHEHSVVSSKRPSSIRSSQMVKASPNAARVSAVGQTKSAITVPPASITRSHIQPMRRACSTRSSWLKPRSRERLVRTASALNTTAFRSGANVLASVVLPAPGKPIIRIFRFI
jgi:hypothetical protein